MSEIQEMLAQATSVEVLTVLFRTDFYCLVMEPMLDPVVADLEECWQLMPQTGWMITADGDDNITAHSPERYEPTAGWRYVATMALVLIPQPGGPVGMSCARGLWCAMAGEKLPPQVEEFLDFLCTEMVGRLKSRTPEET